jgi:3-hydroxyacyl-[acyl-carrier-protein] dehydratase
VRFELIDRVLDQQPTSLRAIKVLSSAEEYLADHFPDFPVMPGVLMLESLAQAGRRLVAATDAPPDRPLVVGEVRNLRYGNMVRPGQSLVVEVTLRKHENEHWQFQGVGTVDEQVAVQGRFTLSPIPA